MSAWLDTMLSFLEAHWPDAKYFFNSVFFMAIAGSLAGAFAGARAAQKMADKARNRDELLKELRATNAAIMVAFGICNSLLSAKRQHIKSLKETFDQHKIETKDAITRQQAGTGGEIKFLADYRIVPDLNVPVFPLQTQILERLSWPGRPILLVTTLAQTVEALNLSIRKRNQLIDSFKAGTMPVNQVLALYFGFVFGGRVNEEYANTVEAIYRQTDDAIFFSSQLCRELSSHGDRLLASFKRRFGRGAPGILKPDFAQAGSADLMPDETDYADWMNMFAGRPQESAAKPKAS